MGQVWRGTHVEQGVPVAVKLLRPSNTRPTLLEGIRNEVRAVAGLDHPHVIWLYDQGEIVDDAGGLFPVGTPWLAMEFCAEGTLADRRASMSWPLLQQVLLELLDALAHAHARGVIHRDIKPANVLFGGERPGVKLTDFGMAYLLEEHLAGQANAPFGGGTLSYMSPEQLERRYVDQGAWTDLYSLGAMAWSLVSGRHPYSGEKHAVRRGHLYQTLPRLEPRFDVPTDLEEWLRTLMHKRSSRRFRCAADAARELLAMRGLRGGTPVMVEVMEEPSSVTLAPLMAIPQMTDDPDDELSIIRLAPRATLEVPEDWREGQRPPTRVDFIGAGLGLYGLRELPLVGRERERNAVWDALLDVREQQRAHVMVLRGPVGCGKSRLARWALRRAAELGAADTMQAEHSPVASRREGVAELVAKHTRCTDERRTAVLARITKVMSRLEVSDVREILALTELVEPAGEGELAAGDAVLRLSSASGRHAVVRRYLRRVARHRPVLVLLDDVQWGLDSLSFARRLLTEERDIPVLLLLTVQEEALVDRHAEQEAIDELLVLEGAVCLELGPLDQVSHRKLVGRLGLNPRLGGRVAGATEGNPLFATQLIGDWINRGLLKVGQEGFELREEVELPRDLGQLWRQRLDLLVGQREDWRQPLELAAVLGLEVVRQEWRQACTAANLVLPHDLVPTLIRLGLARSAPRRWTFVHSKLRDALKEGAWEQGRLKNLESLCGDLVRDSVRAGRHLLAAGRIDEALEPLLEGARDHTRAGEYRAALRLLDERDAVLDEGDPRIGASWLLRARLSLLRGELGAMKVWTRRCRTLKGTERVRAELLEAGRLRAEGQLDEAAEHVQAALARADALGDNELLSRCLYEAGVTARRAGDLERACRALDASLLRSPSSDWAQRTWLNLATCNLQLGRYERTLQCLDRAEDTDEPFLQASGYIVRGDLYRHNGELEDAEEQYRLAWQVFSTIGHHSAGLALVNLGITLVEQGDFRRAEQHLRDAQRQARTEVVRIGVHLGLLVCTVERPEWPTHLEALKSTLLAEVDMAKMAEQAARMAAAAGRPERSVQALDYARGVRNKLGR